VVVIAVLVASALARGQLGNTNTATGSAYSATKPGPNCDTGSGQWQNVDDPAVMISCQNNGLLITRQANSNTVGEVFFKGTSRTAAFPLSYRVQIDAAVQSGDSDVGVGLHVHVQQSGGGHLFYARASGEWEAELAKGSGQPTYMALGFLPRGSKSYHLEVDVQGPVMTFSIDGKQVDAITENSFSETDGIGLALSDPQATVNASALFSNFTYTPLPAPTISPGNAVATATATAKQAVSMPYRVTVPGPGCDTRGGQWAPPSVFGDTFTVTKCTKSGLQMTEPAGKVPLGLVGFFNRDGSFPANYSASVKITMSQLHQGCAGVMLRGDLENANGYFYLVCDIGKWLLFNFDSGGNLNLLSSGQVARQSSYTLTASVGNGSETLSINGKALGQANDGTLTKTNFIALVVLPLQKTASSAATFANFAFTPLA